MENALKMGFQISHLWWAMSTRGFNIMGKTVNLIRGGLPWVHHILWSNVIPSHSPSMVQTDLKHFWSPGREEDPSCPASEHILAQGRGIKSVMNHTLNASNPFYVIQTQPLPLQSAGAATALTTMSYPLSRHLVEPVDQQQIPESQNTTGILKLKIYCCFFVWWQRLPTCSDGHSLETSPPKNPKELFGVVVWIAKKMNWTCPQEGGVWVQGQNTKRAAIPAISRLQEESQEEVGN